MRAGLLREFVSFFAEEPIRNRFEGGAKRSVCVLRTRCYRLKEVTGRLVVNAGEEFQLSDVKLQIRKERVVVKEQMLFEYQNKIYRITNIDERLEDNTLVVSGRKIND